MTQPTPPPAEQIDTIRAQYRAHLIGPIEACAQIREVMNVTAAGAQDLLDDDRTATERYAVKPVQA